MNFWLLVANEWSGWMVAALWRASWHGALALGGVYALCRLFPGLPAGARCWLWRLAYLKLLVALFWSTPVALPILPAQSEMPALWKVEAPHVLRPSLPVAGAPNMVSETPTGTFTLDRTSGALVPIELGTGAVWSSLPLALMAIWAIGAMVCAGRVLRQWRRTSGLRSACMPSENPAAARILSRLCHRLKVLRKPELLCADVPGPLVVGALRPAIVLPSALEASELEQEWILAHELAHVKRRDLLWAHLPLLTRVLFYFHPLVWLGHREWRLAQEMACDALTLRLTSASAGDYGELLVKLAACYRARPQKELSVARILEPGSGLERRLSMLPFSRGGSSRWQVIGAVLLGVASLALIPWRVSAQAAAVRRAPSSLPAGIRPAATPSRDVPRPKVAMIPPTASKPRPANTPAKPPKATVSAPLAPKTLGVASSPKLVPATPSRPTAAVKAKPVSTNPAAGDLDARNLQSTFSLALPLQALTGNPNAKPGDGSGFYAIGINGGPYTALLESLTPAEFRELLAVELKAATSVMSVTRARVDAGQETGAELIPLEAKTRQLEILLAAAERLRDKVPAIGRADLAQMLTPEELVQFVGIETKAALQLLGIKRAQFEAGVGSVTTAELAPLETRARQLAILLGAAERRVMPAKGGR